MRVRNFSDRIDPAANVRPELIEVFGLGKQRTQADDRQRWLCGRLVQGHSDLVFLKKRRIDSGCINFDSDYFVVLPCSFNKAFSCANSASAASARRFAASAS